MGKEPSGYQGGENSAAVPLMLGAKVGKSEAREVQRGSDARTGTRAGRQAVSG